MKKLDQEGELDPRLRPLSRDDQSDTEDEEEEEQGAELTSRGSEVKMDGKNTYYRNQVRVHELFMKCKCMNNS